MLRSVICRELFPKQILAFGARSQSSTPQTAHGKESDYENSPKYPAIFDTSVQGRKRLTRQDRYDAIKMLPTAEEKLMDQSGVARRPRIVAYVRDRDRDSHPQRQWAIIMDGLNRKYGTLAMRQFATRTHLIHQLPSYYERLNVDALADTLRPAVLSLIRTIFQDVELYSVNKANVSYSFNEEKALGTQMVDNIFRMVAQFNSTYEHLRDCQVDYDARRDAFWHAGGFNPPPHIKMHRKNKKHNFGLPVDHPVDLVFQYLDHVYMQIRNEQPLPEFLSKDDPLCNRVDVPRLEYHPQADGFSYAKRYLTSIPGYWQSDPCGFGTLTFQTREAMKLNSVTGMKTTQDNIHGFGVSSSFALLCAQAYNKGFSPYHELTYPMTTQTVVTNGKLWSFFAYQLNTVCLSLDVSTDDRQNICWATEDLPLFDSVVDGEVKGFNETVFKNLLKFFVNKPQARVDINLTPYLATPNHPEGIWNHICSELKGMYCNRPAFDRDEVFLWEKIYKKWFKTWVKTVDRTGRDLG